MAALPFSSMKLEAQIKAEAFRLGFSLCGITTVEPPESINKYEDWLAKGFHADMTYLTSKYHLEMRRTPSHHLPWARSIISLGWKYPLHSMESYENSPSAWLAGYTNGIDYHLQLPQNLEELRSFIQQIIGKPIQAQAFTDSAPILEREIAVRAGLGWIGRNSCIISPDFGSGFLLAEMFIDFPLESDQAYERDLCGSCHKCLDACPTHCIKSDRTIDSNNCISYLTIENKKNIPGYLRPAIGKWLFGCDICQMVCPWNQKTLQVEDELENLSWSKDKVLSILSLSQQDFHKEFGNTSVYRAKLLGLQRNALVWLGNYGDKASISVILECQKYLNESFLLETSQWAVDEIIKRYPVSIRIF